MKNFTFRCEKLNYFSSVPVRNLSDGNRYSKNTSPNVWILGGLRYFCFRLERSCQESCQDLAGKKHFDKIYDNDFGEILIWRSQHEARRGNCLLLNFQIDRHWFCQLFCKKLEQKRPGNHVKQPTGAGPPRGGQRGGANAQGPGDF